MLRNFSDFIEGMGFYIKLIDINTQKYEISHPDKMSNNIFASIKANSFTCKVESSGI